MSTPRKPLPTRSFDLMDPRSPATQRTPLVSNMPFDPRSPRDDRTPLSHGTFAPATSAAPALSPVAVPKAPHLGPIENLFDPIPSDDASVTAVPEPSLEPIKPLSFSPAPAAAAPAPAPSAAPLATPSRKARNPQIDRAMSKARVASPLSKSIMMYEDNESDAENATPVAATKSSEAIAKMASNGLDSPRRRALAPVNRAEGTMTPPKSARGKSATGGEGRTPSKSAAMSPARKSSLNITSAVHIDVAY